MKSFEVPTYEQVDEAARPVFDQYKKLLGVVPNLYATIGYSAVTLNAYVAYTTAQAKGSFHAKEREAVYLIVSQLNHCEYCLASHTVSAVKNGWKEEDTLLLRAGTYPDKKWETIYAVVKSIIDNRGEVSDALLEAFLRTGVPTKGIDGSAGPRQYHELYQLYLSAHPDPDRLSGGKGDLTWDQDAAAKEI